MRHYKGIGAAFRTREGSLRPKRHLGPTSETQRDDIAFPRQRRTSPTRIHYRSTHCRRNPPPPPPPSPCIPHLRAGPHAFPNGAPQPIGNGLNYSRYETNTRVHNQLIIYEIFTAAPRS
ncbi:unnamed protein product, partial [Iphiclides podalirius]